MRFTTLLTKLRQKIRNIFIPEIMVGGRGHHKPNRKERRTAEALARKQSRKHKRRTKQ